MAKYCSTCGFEGDTSLFVRNRSKCLNCQRAYSRQHYQANKERKRETQKAWAAENKDKIKVIQARHYENHKDKKSARDKARYLRCRDERLAYSRLYRLDNLESIAAKRKKKYNTNVQERLSCVLRSRMYEALKGDFKAGSAVDDLGCSIGEFKLYIENQFEEGMNWDNYGQWHLDHVAPLSSFDLTDRVEFLEACNWLNIRPLWASDNLSKGAKYER